MFKLNIVAFLLFSLLGVCIGQVIQTGQCDPNIAVAQNFDPTRFQGLWYDIESYPAPFQTGSCPTAEYTLIDGVVHLVNSQVQNQLLEIFTGTATVVSGDGSAKLEVTINVEGNDVVTSLWVLATDYENYTLAYSCTNLDGQNRAVQSWKMSRTTALTPNAATAINEIISNVAALNQNEFIQRSHTAEACFYYPDNNGGDVILNGQCVASNLVPAVTNFNANLFAGTWYEVSRFPSALQTDECVTNQLVTSGANAYNVISTRVNNERQITVNTQGTINNGGRGVITINVASVPFNNIYVLATNNTEYALLYACRNLNAQQKQIYSWKLSKSRNGLSNAANVAIDQAVNNNIDLHEQYYRTTAQDNNACFYYPVFEQLPAYIEMPVPCLDNIRGVPDFRLENYTGNWYEIARYPTTNSRGQCNRAEYNLLTQPLPNNMSMSFTAVANETLETESATARLAEDSSGHFIVEATDANGVTRTFNYYVLATDYTSYSLIYSCANLESGTSIVSSWKRSRAPTLSAEANTAINNVIANTRGISEEYFQTTSQTYDACFYIPTLNPQLAPQFRGQCQQVTGVVNFDINRYLGWWHEIESYPTIGTGNHCRSSEYLQEGNSYRVVDTVVRNNNGFTVSATVTASANGQLTRPVIGNLSQNIWVLATDYETYSLLYSCVNINSENKTVWSAIHSKTRDPVSEEIKAALAPIIASNRVLIEDFYLPVDQSDDVCFHYPSNSGGLIPGQCDATIPVVENFNATALLYTLGQRLLKRNYTMVTFSCDVTDIHIQPRRRTHYTVEWATCRCVSLMCGRKTDTDAIPRWPIIVDGPSCRGAIRFAGDWFHIERYEDSSHVSCVGSSFTVEGSAIHAVNFEVRDDELETVNGTATVVSTDGSARIQLTFPGDSGEITTTVFILATDYTDYAVAYSCEGVNEYQRQVRAWKLSRTRSLSTASNAVINGLITQRQELHQPYFQRIVQNDDCPNLNSAFLMKTSFIMVFVLTLLHRLL